MNAIITYLDDYLRKIVMESIGAVETNALLDKVRVSKDGS